jgi:hypothetical protein
MFHVEHFESQPGRQLFHVEQFVHLKTILVWLYRCPIWSYLFL